MQNTKYFKSENNVFRYCTEGGIIISSDAKVEDYGSSFYSNNLIYFCDIPKLTLILDNSAHIAAIGILVKTHAKFVNTKMYNNIAFEVGTLQVDMDVNLVLINLEIFDNFAYNKAGVISVLHMCNMTVNNTIFRNNIV